MAFFNRVANLFRRSQVDREIDAELQAHVTLRTDDNLAAGMSPAEARRDALVRFGNPTSTRERVAAADAALSLESIWADLRYALRQLRRSPGFTAVALITLALGIGANTAIFSVIDAVMFRALPVEDPKHLVVFSWTAHHHDKIGMSFYGDCADECSVSVPFFQAAREQTNVFSGMAAFAGPLQIDLSGNGPASIAQGEFVSGDYFSTLGLKTAFGRPLGHADDTPSAPPAIVLDYRYWQRSFGADPSSVGRTVRINNVEAVIAGVADPRFTGLTPGKTRDFFMPLSLSRQVRGDWWGSRDRLTDPTNWWVVIVARLKPGASIVQAQAEASAIFRSETLRGAKPMLTESDAPAIKLLPAREGLNNQTNNIAPMLNLIMAAVAFVLLIACANVAGLTLARSAKRRKEMAVRQALGARRARIVRQLLTESLLLSTAGGVLGILVAFWGVEAIVKLLGSGSSKPFPFVIAPDWRVLAFTTAVTLVTGIVSGLAPTLRTARLDLTPALRENASSLPGGDVHTGRGIRLSDALVVAQVALSIVVLVGAGLLVRTLRNLETFNPGFDSHNVLLFGINPKFAGYKDRQTSDLYRDLQQRFAALPGVLSASYSEEALLSGGRSSTDVHLDGAPAKSNVNTDVLPVGLDFFSAMRIPVLAGHPFTSGDFASASETHAAVAAAEELASKTPAATPVPPAAAIPVIVNQTFVRKYFPNQDALGRHIGDGEHDEPPQGPQPGYRIGGIVADSKYDDLRRDIQPTMFIPLVGNRANFELRTAADPTALVKQVRQIIANADSNLPLFDVRTQSDQIEQMLYQERLMSRLSSFFALLALTLACVGLYGLLSYDVAQRTREIGIRTALGAQRGDLMRLVVRQGLLLVAVGAVVGIGAAVAVTRLMAGMLFNVGPSDPATYASVAILLLLVALAACYIPARRAASIDPIKALRTE
jgi:macrolide transport system ATP-binding/permease protein